MTVSLSENSNPRRTTGERLSDLSVAITDKRSAGAKHVLERSTANVSPSLTTWRASGWAYIGHVECNSCLSITMGTEWETVVEASRRNRPLKCANNKSD